MIKLKSLLNETLAKIFNERVISKPKIVGNTNDTINKSNMGLGGGGATASLATSPSHLNKMER
jgi:hypothetical protein